MYWAATLCNWELLLPIFRHLGIVDGIHVITLPHDDARIDAFFTSAVKQSVSKVFY